MEIKSSSENLDEILEFARKQENPSEVFNQYQLYRSKMLSGKMVTENYFEFMQDKHNIALEMIKKVYQKKIYELP